MVDPAKRSLLEAHFQIGLYLKESFVPRAFLYFLNIPNSRNRKVSKTSSHDSSSKKKNIVTASPLKTPISRPSSKAAAAARTLLDPTPKHTETVKMNGQIPTKPPEEDSKSAIVEVLPPPAADTIVGRYRLVKSENFDEFMRKLGVGLVKRKLANSISPTNVIIVNDDGSYTIRTESTVRTTELNFQLGLPFKEETLDGRITTTTATRIGNVLTLDQLGDQAKGEMSTKHIRDFQDGGDKMLMTLVASDVVCNRHYEKIKED